MDAGNHATTRRSAGWQIAGLAGFIAICLAAGGLGSIATTPNIPTWYAGLAKPWFNPPNAVFPVVWTLLYVMIAVSAWLVWREQKPGGGWALVPFFLQLALNVGWSFAFFAGHSPFLGLVVIAVLFAAILWTIAAFLPASRAAAALLLPYAAWVAFAAVLNAAIYMLN